ncbi:MAG: (2Fe-2S)-binding protein [Rhodobacterales bacterium]|uniref:(2Fe-2S)-binding protein n=1 Tax=Puniceibacterium antarcticum TaxID=1206336 RepID=UPI000C193225|nr:(2Fe-2S)-binding protein [Puniceibacterium antarcticum]
MIVCHCKNISDHDILRAVEWMRAADDKTIITPGKVYRALGKSADCGGCMPIFLSVMRSSKSLQVPVELRNLRGSKTQEFRNERRHESY